jgi:two-component system, NtrC family, sensor histidine kinase PilS
MIVKAAKTFPLERVIPQSWLSPDISSGHFLQKREHELGRRLLWLIVVRTVILFLGLNLARPLGILPERLGTIPFVPFFNTFSVTLAFAYLALWRTGWRPMWQLYLQTAVDLGTATVLVAGTRGSESPFVSFYLLIIIYCSLTLGRNGGLIGAALSTILYAGVIGFSHVGILDPGRAPAELNTLTFRISLHALGFFSVAFLGSDLSHRLTAMQQELEQKIDSLEQLQRLTENIVSSIRSGLITTDLEGNITLFNRTAQELTEQAYAEVRDRPIGAITGEDLWSRVKGADLFRDIRPLRHEDWIALPSGSKRFLGYSVSPLLNHERNLIGYIVSFQDLTEIKRLEEEIRLKDRMAAVGQMAAGIAHEIRNPLAAMRGSVEILRSHLSLPGAEERLLDIMVRESDRLNKFVEDFLTFAKPARCAHQPLDLVPLLHDSVTLLKNSPEVREKYQVELHLKSPQIPLVGNADRLKQVFWNLAQNALRAMPAGGTLIVAARTVSGRGCEVSFQDFGAGMTEEEKASLFQPFQPRFAGGMGLGLSIIFQIVEDHHGKIRFDSEKGRGTTVTLLFPPPGN